MTTWISRSCRVRSMPCSARTVPARARWSRSSMACCIPMPARSAGRARRSRSAEPPTCSEARRLGIGMVFQHFSLFETLTVAENIALAIDDPAQHARASLRAGGIVEVSEPPMRPCRSIPHRADPRPFSRRAPAGRDPALPAAGTRVCLIMDEPTSVLDAARGRPAVRDVLVAGWLREGCAILYISHKLEEIKALCDRATIMRQRPGGHGAMRSASPGNRAASLAWN